ncbi:MAG: T9SS type A sorting domain-containing protein [Saprospiraceae bacterium]|nr:T9SS type A sorting domain-containing protein [Saprospiraceae bacterium]MBK8818146.1 T9SS type A sorting domain-containing protein [Saprospiraceae bacterium]
MSEICDISGRIIKTTGVDHSNINVCDLQRGTYILKLSQSKKTGWVKFVKM